MHIRRNGIIELLGSSLILQVLEYRRGGTRPPSFVALGFGLAWGFSTNNCNTTVNKKLIKIKKTREDERREPSEHESPEARIRDQINFTFLYFHKNRTFS